MMAAPNNMWSQRAKRIKQSRGFTILVAALTASLVLALGISVFTIAQKQLILSSLGRNSQYAFYAADTAAECALYWDIREHAFGPPIVAEEGEIENTTVFLTSGTSWTVPDDWDSTNNTVEVIGGGGNGGADVFRIIGGGGGGGGAYSKVTNVTLTPASVVSYAVGGAAGDTYFCNASTNCGSISGSSVIVGAKGGSSATLNAGGAGGAAASGIGTTKYSGGAGANRTALGGGTGGGAAGPGGAGGAGSATTGGTGGGGAGGAGGASGSSPAAGSAGTEWDATHGSGGGGGAHSGISTGASGGLYGGGGGGTSGAGRQGIIAITYGVESVPEGPGVGEPYTGAQCDGQELGTFQFTGFGDENAQTFQFEPNGYCANVSVVKNDEHPRTVIHADGFSTSCADIETSARALQRSVELTY